MCVLMMILALAYVAFQVGDTFVFTAALITAGAVFGFFVWNFPAGLIFLGDGGAYLLGFLLGELCILLVHRNAAVSPMFPLLLCAYPVFETIFTMYRRKFVRGVATGAPDGIHLHTLIHRRLVRWTLQNNPERRRLTRRKFDDLALPLDALPDVHHSQRALVGQHGGTLMVPVGIHGRVHLAVLAHRAFQDTALDGLSPHPLSGRAGQAVLYSCTKRRSVLRHCAGDIVLSTVCSHDIRSPNQTSLTGSRNWAIRKRG